MTTAVATVPKTKARRVVAPRPDFVSPSFAGKCKIFPKSGALLLPYQQKWVEDNSIMKLMEKGRRIGVSYATAYERVRKHSLEDRVLDSWVSSRDEPTSRLVVRDCKGFARLLHIGAKDLGLQVLDEKGGCGHVLAFANNTNINSVAGNPDVFAGKGGDVLLDEFAIRQDPRGVYSMSFATIDWGGTLAIISTHRGTANFFNQLVLEARHKGNPKGFSLHRVTLQDALEQGLLYKLQTHFHVSDPRMAMDESTYFDYQRKRAPDAETFAQEYMCVPSDDESAFLSYDLLDSCKYKPNEKWELTLKQLRECKDPLYLGGDIARVKDLTVFWIVRAVSQMRPTVHRVALRNVPFEEQERRLYQLLELPSLRRACIDNSGLGRQLVERAQGRFGTYKVEPVTFTLAVKEELAYPLRAAFEDKTARIPDDPVVIASHRAVRKETTQAGNIRFVAEANEDGHADDFWAHALALHAGKTATTNYAATLI